MRCTANPGQYHYYEPFVGSGSVAFRTIRNLPFRSFHLSDSFDWVLGALQAVRGDRTDWGDVIDRAKEARAAMLPELDHEKLIRVTFEEFKDACRDGDYFAYLFLCQYAVDQYVHPERRNTASLDWKYIGHGLRYLSIGWIREWRHTLQKASVQQADAFEVLESLGSADFAYIDPPYFGHQEHRWRLYSHDWWGDEHLRLRELLYNAPFSFAFSINEHPLTHAWYIRPKRFRSIPLLYPWIPRRSNNPSLFEWLITNY